MKKIFFIILLFIAAVGLYKYYHRPIFTNQNGQIVDLKNHPGQWMIINYWAPWCEPCKRELPEINHFYLTHRHHVVVYGVNYDHPPVTKLKAFAKKMGLDYPLLVQDPAKYLRLGNIRGLPTTFIFNPKGKWVKVLVGPQTRVSLEAAINSEK